MEYVSYQMVAESTGSLNTGSYLTRTDYSMFIKGFEGDLWYGFSPNDAIELGVFDYDQNIIAWGTLNQEKRYNTRNLSYLNTLDAPITYSYSELIQDFILYKNDKILVNPSQQVSQSLRVPDGSYILTYNFVRGMAGTPTSPLIIKEVSPSRKELKMVPVGGSTPQYEAFCKKKFLVSDISSLYIQLTSDCRYSQIYNEISSKYQAEINTIKSVFFLNTDGAFLTFLKNIYEDLIIYTSTPRDSLGNVNGDPDRLLRIQGIRTYFRNYLLSNSNTISSFSEIDKSFKLFASASIERKFLPLGKTPAREYVKAKEFVYDFFVKYFYQPITERLSTTFNEKYFSYLRNAVNIGNGRLLPIISHDVLDERIESSDPLTLIVKLQSELPTDIMANTNCWVSNISLTPYVVNAIIKSQSEGRLLRIGPPNFSAELPNISLGNVNKSYTGADLAQDSEDERELSVSRKLTELNVDYTNFYNFIIFSSAEVRLNIFKNKMINISSLSSSLSQLDGKNTAFLSASGSSYPFYTQEYSSIQGQLDSIIKEFDGYESYLYRSGNYQYTSGAFVSSSYIAEMDSSASYYDRNNRDSLVNNTPQHILVDENNDEYIVFLTMVGHYFDNIYPYISNLPSEKTIGEGQDESFTRMVTDNMLETFGWKMDNTLEQSNMLQNYLTSDEIAGLNSMSAEDRIKTIRNRILLNLPQIYKSKGTEESVRMLLSCYGVPSGLLSVREYGGVNYASEMATYTQYEKIFMRQWDTSSKWDFYTGVYPHKTKTIEYKFSINNASAYTRNEKFIQWGVVDQLASSTLSNGKGYIRGGVIRDGRKNLGKVFFSVGEDGAEDLTISSDTIPIFDGNVYSVMIRRNDPDPYFQYTTDINQVPTTYDLWVQRNEGGRAVVKSTSSYLNYDYSSSVWFAKEGYLMIGNWFSFFNGKGYEGTFDKMMLWIDPITDSNFEDHVNNPNSYAFSGSRDGYKSLIFRMHTDYPFDMINLPIGSGAGYIPPTLVYRLGIYPNANAYYATSGSDDRYEAEIGEYKSGGNRIEYLVNYTPWSGSQALVYDPVTCQNVSQSIYPYQFAAIDYPCTYTISRYGPNKFRNEKIKYVSQSVEARLDSEGRSTYVPRSQTAPDSNIVGFFADPQDFKNKDIIRQFGNFDFMDIIGSPQNAFSSSYDQLRVLRKKYANVENFRSGSNPKLSELMTIYRLYFNRSLFESIKNLVPARTNVLTGILIEPTILERPKYETKAINSEMNIGSVFYADVTASKYFRDPNTKMVRISETIQHGEFNLDTSLLEGSYFDVASIPSNLYMDIDVSYINEPNLIYPYNYSIDGQYISDVPDKYQLGHFGTGDINTIGFDVGYGKISFDMIYDTHPTGSKKYYLIKKWDTYKIWSKTNEWNRTSNPRENLYVSNSIQLYKYIVVSEDWFKSVAYVEEVNNGSTLPSDIGTHYPNTFKYTPNSTKNNIKADPIDTGGVYIIGNNYYIVGDGSHLEIARGYPRNHYTHKSQILSPVKSQQTIITTIGEDGLEDGTLPVQTFDVSNVNLVQSDNVINQ